MKKSLFFLLILLSFAFKQGWSQIVVEIDPLFEYPVAPEEIEALDAKCDYLVQHFWDGFDFKKHNVLDQYALSEAFGVYITPMQYASRKEVEKSLDKLIKNISNNPGLLLQFTKAAEEHLYGPKADFWSNEIYLTFVDALLKNKKIQESRKIKYRNQASAIRMSEIGQTAPSFRFLDKEDKEHTYFPMSTPTLIIFADPENTDWRLARLKFDSNLKLSDALEKGKVNILLIVPDKKEGWTSTTTNYNQYWIIGTSDNIVDKYDVRFLPSLFLVGQDGKIVERIFSIEEAPELLLNLINN